LPGLKQLILLYGGICLAALALKFAIRGISSLMGKKTSHDQEHGMAHLIKFIIIMLLAILMIFLSRGFGFNGTGSFSTNSESTVSSSDT
jgi:hypothetical protein